MKKWILILLIFVCGCDFGFKDKRVTIEPYEKVLMSINELDPNEASKAITYMYGKELEYEKDKIKSQVEADMLKRRMKWKLFLEIGIGICAVGIFIGIFILKEKAVVLMGIAGLVGSGISRLLITVFDQYERLIALGGLILFTIFILLSVGYIIYNMIAYKKSFAEVVLTVEEAKKENFVGQALKNVKKTAGIQSEKTEKLVERVKNGKSQKTD